MTATQHQVLYALYAQNTKSLEQSFLNLLIHRTQEEENYLNQLDPRKRARKPNTLDQHSSHPVLEKENATNTRVARPPTRSMPAHVDVQQVLALFQRCVAQILGQSYEKTDVRYLFSRADVNGDGTISRQEMQVFFDQLDFCFSDIETTAFFNWIDVNRSGRIDISEFIAACTETNGGNVAKQSQRDRLASDLLEKQTAAKAKETRRRKHKEQMLLNSCADGKIPDLQEIDVSNVRGHNSWTPLHYACSSGSLEVVDFLISKGCQIDDEDRNGVTPIMMAGRNGCLGMCKLLYQHGADLVGGVENHVSVLSAAKLGNHHHVVAWLEQMGINVRADEEVEEEEECNMEEGEEEEQEKQQN